VRAGAIRREPLPMADGAAAPGNPREGHAHEAAGDVGYGAGTDGVGDQLGIPGVRRGARASRLVPAEEVAMNKSWRLTAALAGLFVILTAVYFLSNPPATTSTDKLESPRVLDILAETV